jgi:hypothetical protein
MNCSCLGSLNDCSVRLIGVVWSIASVFAVPIIVREDEAENPVRTVKKSAKILKRTWGEALIGYVGLNFVGGLILVRSMVFLFAMLFLSIALNNLWIIGLTMLLWFFGMAVFSYLLALVG